jgi:hypothetical protein
VVPLVDSVTVTQNPHLIHTTPLVASVTVTQNPHLIHATPLVASVTVTQNPHLIHTHNYSPHKAERQMKGVGPTVFHEKKRPT